MKIRFAIFVALGLVLAACNSGTTDSTTTTESVESTTTSAESTTTSQEETTTTGPAASGGGDDCLEGDWVLDNESFIEQVFSASGAGSFGDASPAGGTLTVSFDSDGTLQTAHDEWGFEIGSEQGTFKILISSDQSGTWATDGDTLSISLLEGDPPEVTTSLEVDGQEVPLPQSPIEVPSEALSASSEFSCDGDTFTVTAEGFTSTFNRP